MDSKRARFEDSADPSEEEILSLVAKRESARQARRFAESDAIREELRSMGVELYDKEKLWRTRDGRRGTLFTAGASECSLSDAEIQEYILEREDARSAKDWARSDNLRETMRQLGVELIDKDSLWRTSSGRCGTYDGCAVQPMPAATAQTGLTSLGVMPPSPLTSSIEKLIAERERLRAAQDFESADGLRRQLVSMGVEIFDKEKIWRATTGEQGVIITGGHQVVCTLSEADIAVRVQQREQARNNKDWGSADRLRDELRRHGVELLDNQKVWTTTDGRRGNYDGQYNPLMVAIAQATPGGVAVGGSSPVAMAQAAAQMALLGGAVAQQPLYGSLPRAAPSVAAASPSSAGARRSADLASASIVALITGREAARERHDFEAADAIRSDLRAHGVEVWDKDKVWRSNDGRSGVIGL